MLMMSELEHFGVKGMKWGVRKDRVAASVHYNTSFKHQKKVYRIIAESGNRELKDIAYVSTNDIDNQRYIHILNHTLSARLFPSARYTKQLILGPTKPLKAPSIQEAEVEFGKLSKSNPVVKKFMKDNAIYFGENPDAKTIAHVINTALVDDDRLFEGAIKVRKEVKQHFQRLGYNSLIDQNDLKEGLAKAPLIVFDPEKTLRVISTSRIDDVIQNAATTTYKETKRNGYTEG